MALDDVVEKLSSDKDERNKWIGVYIGVLAVLLADLWRRRGQRDQGCHAGQHRSRQYVGLFPSQEHAP